MNVSLVSLLLTSAIFLSACQKQQISVSQVFNHTSCGITDSYIKTVESIEIVKAKLRTTPRSFGQSQLADTLPAIDFDKYLVILVAAGQKPTPGYNFVLTNSYIDVHARVITLPLVLQTPEAGAINAQYITSPCTILTVDRHSFTSADIRDYKYKLAISD